VSDDQVQGHDADRMIASLLLRDLDSAVSHDLP